MAEFTLCRGGKCPPKESCQRYKEKSEGPYQQYFILEPYIRDECYFYSKVVLVKGRII